MPIEIENGDLIQIIHKLRNENRLLEDSLRWRNAKTEPPNYDYSLYSKTLVIEFLAMNDFHMVLFGGRYNRETKNYETCRGLPISNIFKVLYWRPLDLPIEDEYAEDE